MKPVTIVAAVLSLSTLSAAWPEALGDVRAVQNVHALLYGRQDSPETAEPTTTEASRSTAASKASSGATITSEGSSARKTGSATESESETATESESEKATDKEESTTAKITGSATITGTKITGGAKSNKTKSFGNNVAPGGIQMITPGVFDGPQYYKVGDWVEFAWNYTSVRVMPTAVHVLVSCKSNQGTYTIAVNQTVEETGRVLWDTQAYVDSGKQPGFVNEIYTLIIYDAESSATALPRPGYLSPFQQFTFGMYLKQNYVPWDQYTCVGCNGALSSHELSALRIIAFTGTTMIASMLFFTHNFGLW